MTGTKLRRKILIVDDSYTSRELLYEIFCDEYDVRQAADGREALDILHKINDISVVVLDIEMPKLDGFGVLNEMHNDELLKHIPVIINTEIDDVEGQLKALDLGAVDVMVKPYNTQIVLHRIRNIILRQEASLQAARNILLEQQLKHSEIDPKTGIYNKHGFCRKISELLLSNLDKQYVIVRWDFDRFKVFNDVFGVAAGDEFLGKVGEKYRKVAGKYMIYGHWDADNFVMCIEEKVFNDIGIANKLINTVKEINIEFEFIVRVGIYLVKDPTIEVALMCDRALLALRSIKNDYKNRIAYYDESMRSALIEEQEIISEMNNALVEGQFVIYLQPQYNYTEKKLHGAEALVRWLHPRKGLLLPGKFIPVFESNGFINRLDKYIWEQVCKLQRHWIDSGVPVVPISVNVSRRDMYNPRLCEILKRLIEKYKLDFSLLRLEITESAYMDNPEQLIKVVEKLRKIGFIVEMDDFGSGYSSLNTLKDVPVDMLKLDMKFLENSIDDARSGSILTSIIRMAHWLKLPVIAEGVETKEQADYLESVGCIYMQGYYCARPMPVNQFNHVLKSSSISGLNESSFINDIDGTENFLSASTQATLLFNSFVGGALIVEFDGENVEALRMNDKYFEVIGSTREEYYGRQLQLQKTLTNESEKNFLDTIRRAIETGEEVACEVSIKPINPDDKFVWTRNHMRFLARNANKYILYISVENISKQKKLMMKNVLLTQQLFTIMDNLPGGIFDFEMTNQIKLIYFNDKAANMFGYSKTEYKDKFSNNPLDVVHIDDRDIVYRKIEELLHGVTDEFEVTYRHICAMGGWKWVRLIVHVLHTKDSMRRASGIQIDIDDQIRSEQTAAKQAEELEHQNILKQALYETIPYGIILIKLSKKDNNSFELISFNDMAWKIYGYADRSQYVEAIHGKNLVKYIYVDDRDEFKECIIKVFNSEGDKRVDFNHRIVRADGAIRWIQVIFQKVKYANNVEVVQAVFVDITERKQEDLLHLSNALFSLFDEVYEINIEQNTSMLRYSKNDNNMIGQIYTYNKFIENLCNKLFKRNEKKRIEDFYYSIDKQDFSKEAKLEYQCIDLKGNLQWISSIVLPIGRSTYLLCNSDITYMKAARNLAFENEKLMSLIDEQRIENERNRIFIEKSGIIMYDYYPMSDIMKLFHKSSDGGIKEENIPSFIATIMDNSMISATDRERLRSVFLDMVKEPKRETYEFHTNLYENGYCLCSTLMTSIANESGEVYRIVGQISAVENEQQRVLGEKLLEITGSDYKNTYYKHALTEEVLHILDNSYDTNESIQTVLSVIGIQLGVSRVYIIKEAGDDKHCSNIYEWCNEGVSPQINNLQNIQYPDGVRDSYIKMFSDNDGMLICSDVSKLPKWLRKMLSPQNIHAIILCAIFEDNEFKGYVGFDECSGPRQWTSMQIHTLRIISDVIASFLFKDNKNKYPFELSKNMLQKFEDSPICISIIDTDTCEILYCNNSLKKITGAKLSGETCYKAFMNKDGMCDICPLKELKNTGITVPVIVHFGNKPYVAQAVSLQWHGRRATYIYGIDNTCFNANLEEVRSLEFSSEINQYAHILLEVYDELYLFDYNKNKCYSLMDKEPKLGGILTDVKDLTEDIHACSVKSICNEDEPSLDEFISIKNIHECFRNGKVPTCNFVYNKQDNTKLFLKITIIQLNAGHYFCCINDITDQMDKRKQERDLLFNQAQSEAQERYRIIVEHTGTAVFEMNYETNEFSTSKSYQKYEISHIDYKELFNETDNKFSHYIDLHQLHSFYRKSNGETRYSENVLQLKMADGSIRWTRVSGTFVFDKSGNPLKTIGTFTDIDDEMRTKVNLEKLSERMKKILANIPTGVAIYEVGDYIIPVYVSDKTCEMFGFTREEYDIRIANGQPINFMPDKKDLHEGEYDKILTGQPVVLPHLYVKRKDDSWFWLRAFCTFERKSDNTMLCYAVLADISKEVENEQKMKSQEEHYRILSESTDTITFDYSTHDDIMNLNIVAPDGNIIEKKQENYCDTLSDDKRILDESKDSLIAALLNAKNYPMRGTYDFQADYFDNGYHWYRAKYVSIAEENGEVYRIVGRIDDISDIISEQSSNHSNFQIDGVTGIRSKDSAKSVIEYRLRDKPVDRFDAILFMDIDDFKQVNDTIGHYDADKILNKIGTILKDLFRKQDITARFGGDEFIVYMDSAGSVENVKRKAKTLIHKINSIMFADNRYVKCSIGISCVIGQKYSFETAFKHADTALYRAKNSGKNQVCVYD